MGKLNDHKTVNYLKITVQIPSCTEQYFENKIS